MGDERRSEFKQSSDSKAVDRDTNPGAKRDDHLRTPLSQLAAWRALRVGHTSHRYLLYRAMWAKLIDRLDCPKGDPSLEKLAKKFKRETSWPTYLRQGDFKKKAKTCEAHLMKLREEAQGRTPPPNV